MKIRLFFLLSLLLILFACNKTDDPTDKPADPNAKSLSIFFVNDMHGQINNFSKIKHIVDEEKQTTNVILASSGDIFSGNPVVDNYDPKGYPMIDIMNLCGFDIAVLGNHEFDYGELQTKGRMEQANFPWVCANVDMGNSGVPEPYEYFTLSVDSLRITFLGLIETNGKDNGTIPSTHPLRVNNFVFQRPENVVAQYSGVKATENSDLYIALTHLGHNGYGESLGDYQLAEQFPYFDLIIGGHSHQQLNEERNNIPIFQSGSYLNNLGRIRLTISNQAISSISYDLINLNAYAYHDATLKAVIDGYNEEMSVSLDEVIGYSHYNHSKAEVGCFYTNALKGWTEADVTFQNTGGIRSGLGKGDISKREIYEIDPFNNMTMIYEMSAADIKYFLKGSAAGFYYSGIQIEQDGNNIIFKDLSGNIISGSETLTLGINDYLPAVYDNYFPSNGFETEYTTAEAMINYLKNINEQVDYNGCSRYFKYQ